MALTVLLTGIVIARGDRVGVRIVTIFPACGATAVSSRADIQLTFDQDMDRASVESRLTLSPPVKGSFKWMERKLVFKPIHALTYKTEYTITLCRGAKSRLGKEMLRKFVCHFITRQARIVYLAERGDAVQLCTIGSDGLEQTSLTTGINVRDYAISPDGRQIAYCVEKENGTINLWLMDSDGRNKVVLVEEDARCTDPAWSPDGRRLAYERQPIEPGLPCIWLIDVTSKETMPLFSDSSEGKTFGRTPRWSPAGRKLAFFDMVEGNIAVYDFESKEIMLIANKWGGVGVWSPDGTRLAYIRFFLQRCGFVGNLTVYSLTEGNTMDLGRGANFDDSSHVWSPGGEWIALSRRKLSGEGWTPGHQLWLVRSDGSEAFPLTHDRESEHGAVVWSPDGKTLAFTRFSRAQDEASYEIWLVGVDGSNLHCLAEGGFWPAWLP